MIASGDRFICDRCYTGVNPGESLHRCVQCNFNLCDRCMVTEKAKRKKKGGLETIEDTAEFKEESETENDHEDDNNEISSSDASVRPQAQGPQPRGQHPLSQDSQGQMPVEAGARAPADTRSSLSCNFLNLMFSVDGQDYEEEHMLPILAALREFGDLATVYSPPRVAAQAMTIGSRPGFSIDTGILKPDGTPRDLSNHKDSDMVKL